MLKLAAATSLLRWKRAAERHRSSVCLHKLAESSLMMAICKDLGFKQKMETDLGHKLLPDRRVRASSSAQHTSSVAFRDDHMWEQKWPQ